MWNSKNQLRATEDTEHGGGGVYTGEENDGEKRNWNGRLNRRYVKAFDQSKGSAVHYRVY